MRIRERFNPHAPFEARRRSLLQRSSCWANFNPRAPCGARPKPYGAQPQRQRFQPTRPLRGATSRLRPLNQRKTISTHAPLAGRDCGCILLLQIYKYFNPRAPCGARLSAPPKSVIYTIFQPTRPLRGATGGGIRVTKADGDFNPRAPCGARRKNIWHRNVLYFISTHAPLAGRDADIDKPFKVDGYISTHAPLAGRDRG